jgi:hypothetical protein
MPCRAPDNADATCDGSTCGFRCRSGYHTCSGECRSNNSVESCGDRCTRCEAPTGGQAICSNGQCDFTCPGGRKCSGRCAANDEICNGACGSGFRVCRGACVADSAITTETCDGVDNNCNGQTDEGNLCQAPSNGSGRCQNGRCETSCNNGFWKCDSQCVPLDTRCGGACESTRKDCGGSCVTRDQCCTDGQTRCPPAGCESGARFSYQCSGGECRRSSESCASGSCSGSVCAACGASGQACCTEGSPCGNNLVCRNGQCTPCGRQNQPCCLTNRCDQGQVCWNGTRILDGGSSHDANAGCTNCGRNHSDLCCAGFSCASDLKCQTDDTGSYCLCPQQGQSKCGRGCCPLGQVCLDPATARCG